MAGVPASQQDPYLVVDLYLALGGCLLDTRQSDAALTTVGKAEQALSRVEAADRFEFELLMRWQKVQILTARGNLSEARDLIDKTVEMARPRSGTEKFIAQLDEWKQTQLRSARH